LCGRRKLRLGHHERRLDRVSDHWRDRSDHGFWRDRRDRRDRGFWRSRSGGFDQGQPLLELGQPSLALEPSLGLEAQGRLRVAYSGGQPRDLGLLLGLAAGEVNLTLPS
jgi:hypothetical protein